MKTTESLHSVVFILLPIWSREFTLDDSKIYCSELIYKGWLAATGDKVGKLVKLGDLNWKPHEPVIRTITNGLPLDRVMITPRDLAAANQLELVLPLGAHKTGAAVKKLR
jgi:hypothetical protein